MSSAPIKNTTAITIIMSNNKNKNAINAIAIRSHHVDDEYFTGAADNSFEGARALR
jgi:hypothetical protein